MTDRAGTPPDPGDRRGGTDADGFYRMSPFEHATGWVGGFEPVDLPGDACEFGPREQFERAVLRALSRPPCVVAFSGGRDSSAILAVAVHLARREGLPEPIAATHDFSGRGEADETAWQHLVIEHLGVKEWHRVTEVDAFDVLGQRARRGLLRYGVLFPALGYCHEPLAELARGGSLVIGEGGDEMLGIQRMSALKAVAQRPRILLRRRPWPIDHEAVRLVAESAAPIVVRRHIERLALLGDPIHPWLSQDWQEAFLRQQVRDSADAPLRWDRAVLRQRGRRASVTAMANIRRVMADDDVVLHVPFHDTHFVASWAASGGSFGYASRTGMMRLLFGDLLPDEVCRRSGKARFGSVAVGGPSKDFLDSWNGEGLDPAVVDIDAFRTACRAPSPLFGLQSLLQAAWLAIQPDQPQRAVLNVESS